MINPRRVKKDDLPSVSSLTCFYVENFSTNNPIAGELPLTKEEPEDLHTINPEAVLFIALQLTRQTFQQKVNLNLAKQILLQK